MRAARHNMQRHGGHAALNGFTSAIRLAYFPVVVRYNVAWSLHVQHESLMALKFNYLVTSYEITV